MDRFLSIILPISVPAPIRLSADALIVFGADGAWKIIRMEPMSEERP